MAYLGALTRLPNRSDSVQILTNAPTLLDDKSIYNLDQLYIVGKPKVVKSPFIIYITFLLHFAWCHHAINYTALSLSGVLLINICRANCVISYFLNAYETQCGKY